MSSRPRAGHRCHWPREGPPLPLRIHPQPDPAVLVVDVSAVSADLVVVGTLARMQLTARRNGCRIALHGASPELEALIELCGLAGVFASERG